MADLGATDAFESLEDEYAKWATGWDEADDAIYAAARKAWLKLARIKREKLELLERLATGGRNRRRPQRSHAEHHKRLIDDFFGSPAFTADGVVYEATPAWFDLPKFHRRYRMGPKLFSRLLHEIQDPVSGHPEFQKGPDAVGEKGASALQKLTAVMRILAYGVSFDAVHEYTGVARGPARNCTYAFCDWLSVRYGGTYLGVWTPEAIAKEMEINEKRGFKGMLGSIDCTHWEWKNCPMPWQGQFQDRNGHRSVVAEAIAGHDMFFWHVFVGCPGSMNDINIMGVSDLSTTYMKSAAATTRFTVGDTEFEGAYFLADGIYPNYAYLMKTISNPTNPKEKLFAKHQEGVRKDVERAFGRLLIKWHILNCAAQSWFLENVKKIWRACFILHNMTIRDNDDTGYDSDAEAERAWEQKREQDRIARTKSGPNVGGGGVGQSSGQHTSSRDNPETRFDAFDEIDMEPPDMHVDEDDWEKVLDRLGHMQDPFTNYLLKAKTVDALWEKKGDGSHVT